jgi:drug/metabolite transporter (DMT)-like permease
MTSSATSTWRANILLTIVTAIWGFGFVAQRVGMQHIGAFTFNALRFSIGCLALFAVLPLVRRFEPPAAPASRKSVVAAGAAAGAILFIASYLQTAGLATTSAGKAGFITGFYVVLVPVLGLAWKQRTGIGTWLGGALALAGLYLLSVNEALQISTGDLLVLASAFFWAAHIQTIAYLTRRVDPLIISIGQFVAVSIFSAAAALLFERDSFSQIGAAWGAILFGGVVVVGIAFTLQVIAQREAHPGHAAVIMVSEAMWGVLAGWLLLSEQLSARSLAGCGLMLLGMLISQAAPYVRLDHLPWRRLTSEP